MKTIVTMITGLFLSVNLCSELPVYSAQELITTDCALHQDEFIVRFEKGEQFPVKIKVSGDMFEISGTCDLVLTPKCPVFFKFDSQGSYYSSDAQNWANIPKESLSSWIRSSIIFEDEKLKVAWSFEESQELTQEEDGSSFYTDDDEKKHFCIEEGQQIPFEFGLSLELFDISGESDLVLTALHSCYVNNVKGFSI